MGASNNRFRFTFLLIGSQSSTSFFKPITEHSNAKPKQTYAEKMQCLLFPMCFSLSLRTASSWVAEPVAGCPPTAPATGSTFAADVGVTAWGWGECPLLALLAAGIGTLLAGVSTGAKYKQNNYYWPDVFYFGHCFHASDCTCKAGTFVKAKILNLKFYLYHRQFGMKCQARMPDTV